MYCTRCGKPVEESWQFCRSCGNPLHGQPEPPREEPAKEKPVAESETGSQEKPPAETPSSTQIPKPENNPYLPESIQHALLVIQRKEYNKLLGWLMALVPIIGIPLEMITGFGKIYFCLNIILGYIDGYRLKKQGIDTGSFGGLAVIVPLLPVQAGKGPRGQPRVFCCLVHPLPGNLLLLKSGLSFSFP